MSHAYPLLLDISDRLIVIVGGGGVAVRKCEGVLAAGATRVRIVSPTFRDDLPSGVERISEPYRAEHLAGAALVFAATDLSDVNDAVVRDAKARGVLVSRADGSDEEPGDFSTPAVHRTGAVTLTVSTGGSPALAARIRDEIVARLDGGAMALADAMQTLRPMILADRSIPPAARRELFRKLASDEAIKMLQNGGPAALAEWIHPSNAPPAIRSAESPAPI